MPLLRWLTDHRRTVFCLLVIDPTGTDITELSYRHHTLAWLKINMVGHIPFEIDPYSNV